MSPLAQNPIAAEPTLQLTSTKADAAPAPTVPATDANFTLILSAFSPGTRRQLELTVNALSRSFRKAIRHAERLERDNAPFEEQDAAWERVNHRSALLQDFIKSLALPATVPAPTPEPASAPAPKLESAETAQQTLVTATNQESPCLATPVIMINSDESALFGEYLTEFRRVRALPDGTSEERCARVGAIHRLHTDIRQHGEKFASRMHAAMAKIDAEELRRHRRTE